MDARGTTLTSRVALAVVAGSWWLIAVCQAQTVPAATFEVASVKSNTQPDGPRNIVVDRGRFTATGAVLADLIRYAYGFDSLASQNQIVGGPSWIASVRFDIVATSNGQPTLAMLKALLEDRFKVTAHVESRDLDVFALRVDRKDGRLGPAIHPSTSTCEGAGVTQALSASPAVRRCGTRGRPGSYSGEGTSMTQLARTLGNFTAIGRVVLDRTGLGGVFDWTLDWTPSFSPGPSGDAAPFVNPAADSGVSIFTALHEQLGLKLEAQRAAVDVLVVDRAELPTPD